MSHSKKLITIFSFIFLSSLSHIFATGAGVQLSGNPGLFINQDSIKPEQFTARATGTNKLMSQQGSCLSILVPIETRLRSKHTEVDGMGQGSKA